MLYGEECVSMLISCSNCKSRLNEAKILLCGVYCEKCVSELVTNMNETTKEFVCKSCHRSHVIPKEGFMRWKALDEFHSKEMHLKEIYRGESVEELRKSLNEIEKQITSLSLSLKSSEDVIREHCIDIKTKVNLETEIVISQCHDLRDQLLNEIENYELQCLSNLNTNQINTQKFDHFLNELFTFHHKWSEYLKNYQINESEVSSATKTASQLNKTFKKEKMRLDKLIFRENLINFKSIENLKLDKNFLGILELKKIGSIDFKKLQSINLKSFLPNFNHYDYAFVHDFDSFEDGKLAAIYPNNFHFVSITIIDKNRKTLKSSQMGHFYPNFFMKIKVINELVIFYYVNNKSEYCLSIMNSDLQLIQSKILHIEHCVVISLDANEACIYCLTIDYKLRIFDHQLNNIKTVGQSEFPNEAFYITNRIKKVAYRNEKIIYFYPDKMEMLNEDGVLVKLIEIKGDAFYVRENILLLSILESKMFEFSLDGTLIDEVRLENVPKETEFLVDHEDKILFFNTAKTKFYF